MLRFVILCALAFGAASPLHAQQTAPAVPAQPQMTLEDVRIQLSTLGEELQTLREQLLASGTTGGGTQTGTTLQRIDGIETEIRQLTGRVEQLQNDVRRMAEDGGRRFSDLDFRVTELEGGDTTFVAPAEPLGGGVSTGSTGGGAQTALTEQNAFDDAKRAYDAGDYNAAAEGFEAFLASFPQGPLVSESRYWLGQSQFELAQFQAAALSYLNAFTGDPQAPYAPDAIHRLGVSLGRLGQLDEACLTFEEGLARFVPSAGPEYQAKIQEEQKAFGCT
ncbi:MAG: tetratricopeptide repeat protein [Pseudomonadota bacterium]